MSRYIKLAKELTFSPSVMTNGKKAVDIWQLSKLQWGLQEI